MIPYGAAARKGARMRVKREHKGRRSEEEGTRGISRRRSGEVVTSVKGGALG